MQVILLEKIDNVGILGDLVDVKSGFARNFLLPQGKAELATPTNIEAFEQRRAELEKLEADALADAKGRAAKLEGASLTVTSRGDPCGCRKCRSLDREEGNPAPRRSVAQCG